jgi:putative ABC transport system ATP-binding protein
MRSAVSEERTTAVSAVDVHKTFDGGVVRALNGVSLEVARGAFVAITGPSGCGKSTLLHLIAAIDRPTSGSISVDGKDLHELHDLNDFRRHTVGLVFQLHNLLPNLGALENVEVAMFGTGISRRDQQERARRLLGEVGMTGAEERTPPKLSGGERQRVAIARALANDPAILLADEPTGSLDSAAADQVLELIVRLRAERDITIVMVTHANDVAAAADRVIEMSDGAVV